MTKNKVGLMPHFIILFIPLLNEEIVHERFQKTLGAVDTTEAIDLSQSWKNVYDRLKVLNCRILDSNFIAKGKVGNVAFIPNCHFDSTGDRYNAVDVAFAVGVGNLGGMDIPLGIIKVPADGSLLVCSGVFCHLAKSAGEMDVSVLHHGDEVLVRHVHESIDVHNVLLSNWDTVVCGLHVSVV